jgi:hypothetical protein
VIALVNTNFNLALISSVMAFDCSWQISFHGYIGCAADDLWQDVLWQDVRICIEEINPHPSKFLMAKCLMPDDCKRSTECLLLAQKYRPTAYEKYAG